LNLSLPSGSLLVIDEGAQSGQDGPGPPPSPRPGRPAHEANDILRRELHIYAEIDLTLKANAVALCKVGQSGPGRSWKEDKNLMAFLKSL
jgi:hypothetical protein